MQQSRWLDSYADFDRSLWATHSVARPWELARQYPGEITVLDKKAFFWPYVCVRKVEPCGQMTDSSLFVLFIAEYGIQNICS